MLSTLRITGPVTNSPVNWMLAGVGSALCGVGIVQLSWGGNLIATVAIIAGVYVSVSQLLNAIEERS